VRLKQDAGRLLVTHVLAETPGMARGAERGRRTVALDGFRVKQSTLAARLDEVADGAALPLPSSAATSCCHASQPARLRLSPAAGLSEAQRTVLRGWLGTLPAA
jgi:predicted metalloprotease with PDZ domain